MTESKLLDTQIYLGVVLGVLLIAFTVITTILLVKLLRSEAAFKTLDEDVSVRLKTLEEKVGVLEGNISVNPLEESSNNICKEVRK